MRSFYLNFLIGVHSHLFAVLLFIRGLKTLFPFSSRTRNIINLKMRPLSHIKFFLLFTFIPLVLTCSKQSGSNQSQQIAIPLDSAKVRIRSFSRTVSGLGQLQPMQAMWLTTAYPGNFYPNHLGQKRYNKGEVIYRLRGETVAHQRNLLQHDVDTNRADSVYYHQELDRQRDLYEKKLISPQQWNQIQKQYTIVQANLEKADSTFAYFKQMTAYRTPFNGSLSQVQYSDGNYVTAQSRVGFFWNPDSMKLVIPWYNRNLNLSTGQRVSLSLNDSLNTTGKVIFIDSSVDPGSGARDVWIGLDSIPPGLFPEERLPYSVTIDSIQSLAVPQSALIRDQHQYWVMVSEHGKYSPKKVRLLQTQNGWAAIRGNIKSGETVLTKGAYEIYHQQSSLQYQVQD